MIAVAPTITWKEQLAKIVLERVSFNVQRRDLKRAGHYLSWFEEFFPHYREYTDEAGQPHQFPCNAMHREFSTTICSFIAVKNARNAKFVRQGPRGHAKSTHLATGLPIYCTVYNRKKYIVIFADTADQANKQLATIKEELAGNEALARKYPHACGEGPTWNTSEIVTRNGVKIEALGSGKPIRGKRHGAARPDLMIFTDLDADDATFSALERERKWEWFQKSAMKAGGWNTDFVVEGTNLHNESVVGRLMHTPGWQGNVWKAILNWPTNMDLWAKWEQIYADQLSDDAEEKAQAYYEENREALHAGAKVLWPEYKPLLELMQIRAQSHSAFESEYQNNPIDPSKCEWPSEYFTGDDLFFDEWPQDCQAKAIALDPSKGNDAKPGDYSAILMGAVRDGYLYVDADIKHRNTTTIAQDFLTHIKMLQPDISGCESTAMQHLMLNEINHAATGVEDLLLVPPVPIDHAGTKKIVRIRKLSPWFYSRRVKFRRRSPGVTLLLKQLQEFPHGEHDDGPDAMEMMCRLIMGIVHGRA